VRSHHKGRRAVRPDGAGLSVRDRSIGAVGRSDDDAASGSATPDRPRTSGGPGIPGPPGIPSLPGTPSRPGVDTVGRRGIPGARRISDALGVPVDIALNMPRMSFEGNARLVLDNHRGLVEYTPSHLQIDTPAGQIDITGRRLRIRGISREQIVADGWFDRVEFSGWVGNATAGSAGQEAP